MKKRSLFTLVLVALLAFSLGMGTLAYYSNTFVSNDNFVRAAAFKVDTKGILNEELGFDLTGDPLIPGKTKDLYEFVIDKTGTEVPVKYGVTVTGLGKLFFEKSPVKLNLYRKSGKEWIEYDGEEFVATEKIEKFKIQAVWTHSENDIAYQDKTGKVAISVVATQVDADNMPGGPGTEDPDPVDPKPLTVQASYYTKKGDRFIKINVEDIVNAERVKIEFGYKKDGKDKTYTSDIEKKDKEFKLDKDHGIPEKIKVSVYDKKKKLLDEFEGVTVTQVTP